MRDDIETREATYWDHRVRGLTAAELRTDTAARDAEGRRRIALLGDLGGKRLLDVGCGTGFWSVFLARQGAEVWAVDISPGSIALTRRRAELNGVSQLVHASVMSATALEFPDTWFDCVHGQDILHHVDTALLGAELARVLRPDGRAVFVENSANNALLMVVRKLLCGRWGIPRWSSADEYPLTRARLARFSRFFHATQVEYPSFMFFHLVDAYLFRFRSPRVSRLCSRLDAAVHAHLPCLRPYSYRQLVYCERPRPTPALAGPTSFCSRASRSR